MAELVGLPQLIQKLLLLHGGGHLLLLQPGGLPLGAQQLLVEGLALFGGLYPPALQVDLLLVQPGNGLVLTLIFLPEAGQGLLLLGNLPGELRVFLLVVRHQGFALVPVPGHAGLEVFQLGQAGSGGLPLRLQGGLGGGELRRLLCDAG